MLGYAKCAVLGCKTNGQNNHNKHFHRFPADPEFCEVWARFTRRGNEFVAKTNMKICEDHFHPSCFKFTMTRKLFLLPQSVPTIFISPTTGESIVLTFDRDLFTYLEAEKYLISAYDKDAREEDIAKVREKRLEEIKKLCRFCSEELTVLQRVKVDKLKQYSIIPTEIFKIFGTTSAYNDNLSEVICEECFQEIVSFDRFKKRCLKAQVAIVEELKDLDKRLQKLRGYNADNSTDWDSKPTWSDSDDDREDKTEKVDSQNLDSPVKNEMSTEFVPVKFETVIIKCEKEESDNDDDFDYQSANFNDSYSPSFEISETTIKTVEIESEKIISSDDEENTSFSALVSQNYSDLETKKEVMDDEVNDDLMETADTPKRLNPRAMFEDVFYKPSKSGNEESSNNIASQVIYECFNCRLKYAGRDMFTRHDCHITEVNCADKNCNQKFKTMSGYNSHIVRVHKLPRITRQVCKICKMSMVTTDENFKKHSQKCDKTFANRINKRTVECVICKKLYLNQQMLSVHMLFHNASKEEIDAEIDKSKSIDAMKRKTIPSDGSCICEHCGRTFAKPSYLRDHVRRVHRLPNDHKPYQCDICGKKDKTRRGIGKHVKNVHVVNPVSCKVCGKVFKNKNTMSYHMKYHDNTKYIHFCPLCPNRAPWCTAVALKRHQESNHGSCSGQSCDFCNVTFSSRSEMRAHRLSEHGVQ